MSLMDYMDKGGPIMYILLMCNIFGIATMIYKFITLSKEKKDLAKNSELFARRVQDKIDLKQKDLVIEFTKQEVSYYATNLETGINSVKIIATISPLLGLLGTVLGVLSSFQIIAQAGMSDPGQFAGGISMALITTVGGLIVAIPHYIGHSFLIGLLDRIENEAEKRTLSLLFSLQPQA